MKLLTLTLAVAFSILLCNNPWDPRGSFEDEKDLENKEYNDSCECDSCNRKDIEEKKDS